MNLRFAHIGDKAITAFWDGFDKFYVFRLAENATELRDVLREIIFLEDFADLRALVQNFHVRFFDEFAETGDV